MTFVAKSAAKRVEFVLPLFVSALLSTGFGDVEQRLGDGFGGVERRLEDGSYTIVNKANGHRVFASPTDGLFAISDHGPINHDQMWLFAPQVDQSYAIVNAGNGLRLVAQSGVDGAHGFFVMDSGPVYQDQKWRLVPQSDGSYVIVNVKSGRRILARDLGQGRPWFAAVANSGQVFAEETWWLINQERDDTTRLMIELQVQKNLTADFVLASAGARNETFQLAAQLEIEKDAYNELALKTEAQRSQLELAARSNQQLAAEVDAKAGQTAHLMSILHSEQGSREKLGAEARSLSSEAARLTLELEAEKAAGRRAAEHTVDCSAGASTIGVEDSKKRTEEAGFDTPLARAIVMAIVALAALCCRHYLVLRAEVKERRFETGRLEQELRAEFGSMVKVGDSGGDLGFDFGFQIFDTELDQDMVRLVKIQCPGVQHADVEAELIFNGCNITISRRASRGVEATTWKKRFQFRPSDGLFEFKEDQMQLESGFLHLVFRAYSFQNRIIRFPLHFSLAASDTDQQWEYSAEEATDRGDDADAWWHEQAAAGTLFTKESVLKFEMDTVSTASTARLSK